jgi:hypothetical protein
MDANERLHQEWLGMAQPEGLVVTVATLKAAEANVTWPVVELQGTLRELAGETRVLLDLPVFFRDILGWSDEYVVHAKDAPDALRVSVDGGEPLVPAFAVRSADDASAFVLLVGKPDKLGGDLDTASDDKRWTATPHQRFERLLRETGVHVGLLTNGKMFRLVYAPKGETAGWVTFGLNDMLSVDGRPLLGAFHMLLNERRLLSLEPEKRLGGLLAATREYQNTVSGALREQVLAALRELLLGFQHADRLAHGALLADYRRGHLDEIYKGLVTVLMRSVFVVFAEERNLLPVDRPLYAESYSLTRLYAQLVEDRDRYGDMLDDRYGAWARMVSLFRLLHDGVRTADGLHIPARRGDFFDPDAFPFLEGRPRGSVRQLFEALDLPRISDGVVFRVLGLLLILDGERLRYSGLDVEQVGSVYEGVMGFEVHAATAPSLTVKPNDLVVDLADLLQLPGEARLAFLKSEARLDVKGRSAESVRSAATLEELTASLGRNASTRAPHVIVPGSLFLQVGQERRRFGAHYTKRSITRLMVERALKPLLREDATPEQILSLKVCDPSMGSGAFLVETCRQLADRLVLAWERTQSTPAVPPDEELSLHARRVVAQRCLYGVDKNPLAVDLARLSLWLVTFAREHPFTFVDHSLRYGDSLIGLSREQIVSTAWDVGTGTTLSTSRSVVERRVHEAETLRRSIVAAVDPLDTEPLSVALDQADAALREVRLVGDLLLTAFFSSREKKGQSRALVSMSDSIHACLAREQSLQGVSDEVADVRRRHAPFHWEIEFPEAFETPRKGFDAFVGNPPWVSYAGKAAQPLDDDVRDFYSQSPAFNGFRNLQALFVRRCALMLAPGGRIGFVLPTSMSDLGGYGPSRRAHDTLCVCDEELPDFGEDAFDGVFQPSMGLLSTRREMAIELELGPAWPLARTDLDPAAAALLERLKTLPRLPPTLFGERGFQSNGDDVTKFYVGSTPPPGLTVGVRAGSDMGPCRLGPPDLYCDPAVFEGRFRPAEQWKAVDLLIRQTARYPMAALSDGQAFRNSILAGFADDEWSTFFLLAYLNSNPVRFVHYMTNRDARQGMPQMKISHLRGLPAPQVASAVRGLEALGKRLGERNTGIAPSEQDEVDSAAADALSFDESERRRVREWVVAVNG